MRQPSNPSQNTRIADHHDPTRGQVVLDARRRHFRPVRQHHHQRRLGDRAAARQGFGRGSADAMPNTDASSRPISSTHDQPDSEIVSNDGGSRSARQSAALPARAVRAVVVGHPSAPGRCGT
jgi:hypothetical protein